MIVSVYATGGERIENKPAYPGSLMKMPFCSPGPGNSAPCAAFASMEIERKLAAFVVIPCLIRVVLEVVAKLGLDMIFSKNLFE